MDKKWTGRERWDREGRGKEKKNRCFGAQVVDTHMPGHIYCQDLQIANASK